MLLNNFNKTIQLANTVNMDRIAVRIISHAEESLASSLPSLLSNFSIIASKEEGTLKINPTIIDGSINIELISSNYNLNEKSLFLIFNETGKEIYRGNGIAANTENKFTISTLQLSSGNYYLVLNTEFNKNYVTKFIKP